MSKEELYQIIQEKVFQRFLELNKILENSKISVNNRLSVRYQFQWVLRDIEEIIEKI